jgi:predicted nucleotidyltransferase
MNTIRDDILKEIIKRVVDAAHPERIIVFGSVARGEMGPKGNG